MNLIESNQIATRLFGTMSIVLLSCSVYNICHLCMLTRLDSRCQDKAVQWEGQCGTYSCCCIAIWWHRPTTGRLVFECTARRVLSKYYCIVTNKSWDLPALYKFFERSRHFLKLNISKTYGQNYYRTLTGNRTQSIQWYYYFQWPWVTSDPDFKVTTFFDIEYIRNDTR